MKQLSSGEKARSFKWVQKSRDGDGGINLDFELKNVM
jgi:hypothetical protein